MNLRKIGNTSEKRGAKKVNAKTIKGSGNLWYEKGDYETDNIVFQNKYTSKDYQLTLKELKKAKKDGLTKNKNFVFSIEINNDFVYVFERILISEEEEIKLNLKKIKFNKSLKINEKLIDDNLLLNEKYILTKWEDFRNLNII